jgi:APA family basic amino acid/polyamine antiporter
MIDTPPATKRRVLPLGSQLLRRKPLGQMLDEAGTGADGSSGGPRSP